MNAKNKGFPFCLISQPRAISKRTRTVIPVTIHVRRALTVGQLDDIIELAQKVHLSGLVATNTTISREGLKTDAEAIKKIGEGGLSGKPVREKSTQIVQYIHQQTGGALPIIANGGIFTGEDAYLKFKAGASLLQVWTGFVYEGPAIVQNICKHLVQQSSL